MSFTHKILSQIPDGKYFFGYTDKLEFILWFKSGNIEDIRSVIGNSSYKYGDDMSDILKSSCVFNIVGHRCEFVGFEVDIPVSNPIYKLVKSE